ncbi:Protein of unknown function [Gryllus bimaculatus]|nr:Protein of unknown function [Gryllus bimaculatus]
MPLGRGAFTHALALAYAGGYSHLRSPVCTPRDGDCGREEGSPPPPPPGFIPLRSPLYTQLKQEGYSQLGEPLQQLGAGGAATDLASSSGGGGSGGGAHDDGPVSYVQQAPPPQPPPPAPQPQPPQQQQQQQQQQPPPAHYETDQEYHSLDTPAHHGGYLESSPEFYSAHPGAAPLVDKFQAHYVKNYVRGALPSRLRLAVPRCAAPHYPTACRAAPGSGQPLPGSRCPFRLERCGRAAARSTTQDGDSASRITLSKGPSP